MQVKFQNDCHWPIKGHSLVSLPLASELGRKRFTMPGPRKFEDIPQISAETLLVLTSLGFDTATPVQEATIPLFAGNKDVAVDACTGSGKTLSFVIPIIEKFRKLEIKLKRHQVHLCPCFSNGGSRMPAMPDG